MLSKLILYGAGKRCSHLYEILEQLGYEKIVIIVDSNSEKWGDKIGNLKVESPDIIAKFKNVSLCITIADLNAVKKIRKEIVEKYQYRLEKEIAYNKLIIQAYKESVLIRESILNQLSIQDNTVKNILFESTQGLGLGGVESWVKDICIALLQSGENNVYIISNEHSYKIPSILKKRIININVSHNEKYLKNSIWNLIRMISNKMPCKIVISYPDELMLAAYILKYYYPTMIDLITVIHGGKEEFYNFFIDYKDEVEYYIAVSQDIKKGIIAKGADSQKVISMTCPFKCVYSLIRTYTEDEEVPIQIGYAGRMDGMEHSQKRMDLVLKLIETLEGKKVAYKMELAGDGIARKRMEDFVCCKHLENKVHFLGMIERDKMDSFWKRQDICINLADYEGRSISIIEAMGNGAVPVVTATSGVFEDITNDVNGYIVPLGDYYSMADKIEYLSQHRERLHELGQRAHDEVYPKSLMEPHLKLWKEILNVE